MPSDNVFVKETESEFLTEKNTENIIGLLEEIANKNPHKSKFNLHSYEEQIENRWKKANKK